MEQISVDQNKDDSELNAEIDARYKSACAFYGDWEDTAKHDYNFGLGDQWEDADRQQLQDECRPCLTFNRIKPTINLVSGYQRENTARIKVNPEGGEDKVFSEVFDRTLKHMNKVSHLDYKFGYWFDDGLYCGKGWIEGMLKYDNDPILGELDFKQLTPYQIKIDPDSREYDINDDAAYCFKVVRLTKSKLKFLYPDKKKLIDGFVKDNDDPIENGDGILHEGDDDDYGNKPNRTTVAASRDGVDESEEYEKDHKFTLKEYWRYKDVKKYWVIEKETGDPQKFDTEEEAEAFAEVQGPQIKVIPRDAREMWVAARVCGHVLGDKKSPFEPYYSGFPFFRYMSDWAPNADNEVLRCQSMVRALKDPQMEKNKAKSQNLHILNTQANSGWVADDDALTPEGFKDLEELGSTPGIVLKKKKGRELREIQPKAPNVGHINREQMADEEFSQISGVNSDLLAMNDQNSSGKAISLRIKQGIMSLVRLFSNFRYSKELVGKFMLQMTPKIMDEKKLAKILGSEFMQQNKIDEGVLTAFLTIVGDNKYDVLVTESDKNATIRYETFNQLVELKQVDPNIPSSLIIDFMDIPNATEIKEQIQAAQQQALQAAQQKPGK